MTVKTEHPARRAADKRAADKRAADKRAALAAALATYLAAECSSEADIALEAALIDNGITTADDEILDIFGDDCEPSQPGGIEIHLPEEMISIDKDGNVMRGGY